MTFTGLLAEMEAAGKAALEEVRQTVGWDLDEETTQGQLNAYVEALESRVQSLAAGVYLAKKAQGR
jgi:hypothetical protein